MRLETLAHLLPRCTISTMMVLEGPLLKALANNPPGRLLIRRITHGGLGRLSVAIGRNTGLLRRRRPVELAMSILRRFFEPYLTEVDVREHSAVFFLSRCPYGFCRPAHVPLCDAVMQFERELVAGIGARLVIEQTLPQGFSRCRFTLTERGEGARFDRCAVE